MARTQDPNSATSQFFINLEDNFFLDYTDDLNPGYTVFGRVIEGMDVVREIGSSPTTNRYGHPDWPEEDIYIKNTEILHKN